MKESEAVVRGVGQNQGLLLISLALSVAFAWSGAGFNNAADSQPVPLPSGGGNADLEVDSAADTQAMTPLIKKAALPQPKLADGAVRVAASVKQGEALSVSVHHMIEAHHVTLAGRKVRLFPQADGSLLALPSVSVFQKPGSYPLTIYNTAGQVLKTMPITIQDARFRTQNVSVSKSTAGLQPLPGEMEAIQALKERVSSTRYWEEPFLTPTPDCQNSPFGVKRLHNGVPTGDYHKGVDLRSPAGRPIKATNGGIVQIARMYRLHGGTVGLDHGQGVSSIYIHMSKLAVKPGDSVKKGEVIGYVGSTGFASGPHLHWGMYMSGLPINPNQWITGVPKCQ